MEIDIVLLPPKVLSRKIGNTVLAASKKYKMGVVVDDRKLLPHISLLHIKASPKKIARIVLAVKPLASRHSKMILGFSDVLIGNWFFYLRIKNSTPLYRLHNDVVKNASSFRNAIVRIPLKAENQTQKRYFKQYGVANILKFFGPHITLGNIKNPKDQDAVSKFLSTGPWGKFTVNRLAVTKVNNFHQVVKIIKEFRLK